MRRIHIFTTFFDDFQKWCVFQCFETGCYSNAHWEGVFRVLRVHGPPRRACSLFFWGPGGSLGAAEVRTMTILDYNPALVLTIPFLTF